MAHTATRRRGKNVSGIRHVGDVGATYARFAVYTNERRTTQTRVMPVDQYRSLREAIEGYWPRSKLPRRFGLSHWRSHRRQLAIRYCLPITPRRSPNQRYAKICASTV
jgi:hypothetical protein